MAKKKAPDVLADGKGAQTQDDNSETRRLAQLKALDDAENLVANEGEAIGDWDLSAGLDVEDAATKLAKLKAAQQANIEKALKEKFAAWGRRAAWTGILYPEMKDQIEKSTGMLWEDLAENLHVPMLRSPFHGEDYARVIDPKTKEAKLVKKKGHWHVLYYSPGGKFSYKQMKAILGDELGLVMIEPVLAQGALTRYFFHLDCEPFEVSGKNKYPISDALVLSGYELQPYLNWRTEDQSGATRQVIEFAKNNDIYQYSDLVDAMFDADRPDWNYMMTIPNFRQGIRDYMQNRWNTYRYGLKPLDVYKKQEREIAALREQLGEVLELIKDQFGIDLTKGNEDG